MYIPGNRFREASKISFEQGSLLARIEPMFAYKHILDEIRVPAGVRDVGGVFLA